MMSETFLSGYTGQVFSRESVAAAGTQLSFLAQVAVSLNNLEYFFKVITRARDDGFCQPHGESKIGFM